MLTQTVLGLVILLSSATRMEPGAQGTPNQSVGEKDNLRQYTACQFGEKTTVEEAAEMTQSFLRPVETSGGQNSVEIDHGFSLHIAYDSTPFVNFKAERLGKPNYERDKHTLIDNLAYVAAATPEMESSQSKRSSLNGFDAYAVNRKQLAGGVLGIYLLFRDGDHTVVTLYFLNTPPQDPKFRTVEQAHALRDAFLNTYTSCVSKNLAP